MDGIAGNLATVRDRVAGAARNAGRTPESVTLVAGSQTQPAAAGRASAVAGARGGGRDGEHGPPPVLRDRGQYRGRTGEGRSIAGGCRCVYRRMPRSFRPADRRVEVHPARARGTGPTFRVIARNRPAQWAR